MSIQTVKSVSGVYYGLTHFANPRNRVHGHPHSDDDVRAAMASEQEEKTRHSSGHTEPEARLATMEGPVSTV